MSRDRGLELPETGMEVEEGAGPVLTSLREAKQDPGAANAAREAGTGFPSVMSLYRDAVAGSSPSVVHTCVSENLKLYVVKHLSHPCAVTLRDHC